MSADIRVLINALSSELKMNLKYEVRLISIEERDRLLEKYSPRFLYEQRADIYGCCIKLLTDLGAPASCETIFPMSVL
jgi:hypothetical protein